MTGFHLFRSETEISSLAATLGRLGLAAIALATPACGTAEGTGAQGVPETVELPRFEVEYPAAARSDVVERIHGVEVADPYRWLEQPDSETAEMWLSAQDQLLEGFVSDVEARETIRRRTLEYLTYDRISAPTPRGDRSLIAIQPAGNTRQQIWVEEAGGERRLLIDFEEALAEGQRVRGTTASLDGRAMVVQVAEGQSRWPELRVLDVDSGEWGPEALGGYLSGRGGIAWDGTGNGFFYTRFEMPEEVGGVRTSFSDAKLFYHRLGTPQSEDELVYERPDQPTWLFSPSTSLDGRFLVLGVTDPANQGNRLYYFPLDGDADRPWGEVVELIDRDDASYYFEHAEGNSFLVRTSLDAPNQRVVRIDLTRPQREEWMDVIPERAFPIGWLSVADGVYLVPYIVDARSTLTIYELDGRVRREIDFTGQGFLFGLPDSPGRSVVHFGLNVLYDPGTIYTLDVRSGEVALSQRPQLAYDPGRYTFEQVFYDSFDGTRVPMFLVYRKGLVMSAGTPVVMYGYGAAGWSAFPWYQPGFISWLDLGGVYALPGIRGGGEYGDEWWEAGRILNKENVIGDYIAAAEFLVESGRTSPARLVANGGSASGILAALGPIRRPDLFAAGLIQYPTLDMLRYHLFGGWPSEFGTSDDPAEFEVLRRVSPYHNLDPHACYPPMIVQVGALDEVTSPAHGYKFVAAMQGEDGRGTRECGHPQMLKIAWEAGHAPGGTPEEHAQTAADQLSFLIKVLDLDASGLDSR